MSVGTQIAVYMVMLNLAAGIINVALGEYYPETNNIVPTGISYSEQLNTNATRFSGDLSVPGSNQDSSWWIMFANFVTFGTASKIKTFLDNTIYGIIGMFSGLGILPQQYEIYIRSVLSIAYMFAFFELFTGRRAVSKT